MEFARTISESADVYLLGSLIAVTSALMARRCYFPFGDQRIYPNVFVLLAGHPGDRKSSAIQLVERLVARKLLDRNRFLTETSSSEALFDEYYEPSGGSPDKLLIADDANPLFAVWRKTAYGEIVGKRFLTLYDCKGFSESFRRNRDSSEDSITQRYIEETSTSMLLGATFNIAQFQGQEEVRMGLQRRFLYYVAKGHGRFIPIPPAPDERQLKPILTRFRKLLELDGEFQFSPDAEDLWRDFQRENRDEMNTISQDAMQATYVARLNSQPIHVLKVAMIFQSTQAETAGKTFTIRADILQRAIEHVKTCGLAASQLDLVGQYARITSDADWLYAKVYQDFASKREPYNVRQTPPTGSITVSRTELTAKYCHHAGRNGAITTEILYCQLIPNLEERGLAKLTQKLTGSRKPCIMFLRPPS